MQTCKTCSKSFEGDRRRRYCAAHRPRQNGPNLRVIGDGEMPVRALTLEQAAATGDYMQILLAQRRDIVASLPDERGPAKAALHRQLSLVSKEIESLRVKESEDVEFGTEAPEEFDAAAF